MTFSINFSCDFFIPFLIAVNNKKIYITCMGEFFNCFRLILCADFEFEAGFFLSCLVFEVLKTIILCIFV